MRRVAVTIAGGVLVAGGAALLVLPGPGMLVVLAGMVLLASEYHWARRLTEPVRRRADQAAEQSVATRLRIAGMIACGLALIAAGVTWIVVGWLPFSGAATGASLILSGLILLALLIYTYRRVRKPAVGSSK